MKARSLSPTQAKTFFFTVSYLGNLLFFLFSLCLIKYLPFSLFLSYTLTFHVIYSTGFICFFWLVWFLGIEKKHLRLKLTKKDWIFSFQLFYHLVKFKFYTGFSLFFPQVSSFRFVLGWFVWAFGLVLLLNWLSRVFLVCIFLLCLVAEKIGREWWFVWFLFGDRFS